MSKQTMSGKSQLDVLIAQGLSYWEKTPRASDSYTVQRNCFMLKRLQLEAKIILIVSFTITLFFFGRDWLQGQLNFVVLLIGAAVAIGILGCWVLCQTRVGRKFPIFIFLGLSWSVTCFVQIGCPFLGKFDPKINIWNLVFLTQATIIPVLWPLHLISQLGTLIFYLCLYAGFDPAVKEPLTSYAEPGLYLFWTCAICNLSVYLYEQLKRTEFKASQELEAAQEKSNRLLLNILPDSIAERLKQETTTTIADYFQEVTVLFADIVGFTELSIHLCPTELVGLLNQIFTKFDQLAERHGVEKIKTIGDAYMVVAGLPNHRYDHAFAIADMALDMQKALAEFNRENQQSFRIRIGISTGPAVAGVIGLKKFAYDLWGDTVNTASRMESHGIAGSIQVCQTCYSCIKDKYLFEERGTILVKGKGEMTTYLLKGKRI